MGEEYETFLAWKELLAYGKGHLDAREANGFALYPFPLPVSAVSPVESLMDTGIVDGQAGWMSTPYLPDERSGLSASAEQPAAHEPSIGEDTRQADEEVSAFFSDNHPRLPLGRSRAAQRAGILRFTPPGGHAWPPAASTISTHAAHAVPTTAVHATRLRMAPGGASSARGAREESLQASRQFAEEVLSCFHVPVSSLSSVRVTPSPFALDNNLSTNLRALLDSRLMERRGQEDGDAGSGGRLGSERGAKQQDEQRGGKGDVFGGIVSQVIGLATDFDGTVTDVTPPQKSEKENTGEAQKHEQQDYVDTCVTLFSLARQRATDPQMFDETVDEAVRVYSAGRKRILSQFSVDLAGKSVGTKSGNSTRELRQDEVGGWCACPREEAEVESEAPFSLSSTSSPTAALAAVRDVQFNAIKQLDAYEEKMANTPLTRIILRGIRRDTFDTDLLHATNAIDLVKPTALETIFRLRASDVPVTFISHSWSAHLVAATLRHALAQTLEACLSSMGETSEQGGAEREARRKGEEELSRTWAENVVQSMTFHANELVYDERGVSTGLVEPRCVTLEAKRKYARESREEGLQILRRRLMSSGDSAGAQARNAADEGRGRERENFWLIFVGDTHGDILALLEADIGILIGDPRKNMEAILYHTGVVLRPLSWLVENFRQQFKQHEEREAALCASSPSRCPLARAAGQAERERRSQFFFRLPAPQAPCCCPSPFSFSFFASSEDGPHESRCRVLYVAQNWGEIYELLFGAAPPEKGTSAV
ncbi:conserved hypothetical protein [Neospora caninum Liverpool]|uniref:Uncharacterized protein n=1 Tax=Neospora caninum (strain Liverpool) TaxID=572307 RepID=F0VRF0_NEOCL|nr:conserved hypothetical protein [Neospora caninum Liverpool]CBZ56298.1 conserved hypothetical protein [Neospora caninum Liverpool]CEL71060.1 TPA: hypothetical protein BN1204_067230 [Neospora caninum Liverpool]|eukprot:XP_003886323.1 conserved hypothetical protein [Neospora caninum Liverpool]